MSSDLFFEDENPTKEVKPGDSPSLFQIGPEFALELMVCRSAGEVKQLDLTKPAIIAQGAVKSELQKGMSEALSEDIAATSKAALEEQKKKGTQFRVTKPIDDHLAFPLASWIQAIFPEAFTDLAVVKDKVANPELAALLLPQAFFSSPKATFCQAGLLH